MKKTFIVIGIVILLVISALVVFRFVNDRTTNPDEGVTDEIETVITVDGWLKITKICEYEGRLAVVAENVSDTDVEYAILTAKNRTESFTFNASVLLRGTKVLLVCNEVVEFNPDEIYTNWKTENVVDFKSVPAMNEDKLQVSMADNSISVRNVSGRDITSDIIIYYKEKKDDLLNGSMTRRVRVSGGLKADSQTYVNADGLNENNCQIIFTEYDDKKV